jgi:hypothetical protein
MAVLATSLRLGSAHPARRGRPQSPSRATGPSKCAIRVLANAASKLSDRARVCNKRPEKLTGAPVRRPFCAAASPHAPPLSPSGHRSPGEEAKRTRLQASSPQSRWGGRARPVGFFPADARSVRPPSASGFRAGGPAALSACLLQAWRCPNHTHRFCPGGSASS